MRDNHHRRKIVLETEVSNAAALRLYGRLGFIREKRLPRYYLNGSDAFRLKLWITLPEYFHLYSIHHTF